MSMQILLVEWSKRSLADSIKLRKVRSFNVNASIDQCACCSEDLVVARGDIYFGEFRDVKYGTRKDWSRMTIN